MIKEALLVKNEYDRTLSRHVYYMLYSFLNLCTEAEPAAMLSISVPMEGKSFCIEDLADLTIPDKDHFCIIPKNEVYISQLLRGVLIEHPELKPKIMFLGKERFLDIDEVEENAEYQKLIICTVPEVNKERYDILQNTIDAFYQKCKIDMDKLHIDYTCKQTKILNKRPIEEMDEVKEEMDKTTDVYVKMREDMYSMKKAEIEDAYQRYLEKQKEKAALIQEEVDAKGEHVGLRMKMHSDDEWNF